MPGLVLLLSASSYPAGHLTTTVHPRTNCHTSHCCFVPLRLPCLPNDCKRSNHAAFLPLSHLSSRVAGPCWHKQSKQQQQQHHYQQHQQHHQRLLLLLRACRGVDARRAWGHLLTLSCDLSCCSQRPQCASRWPTHTFDSSQASLIIAHTAQPFTASLQIGISHLLYVQ